MGEYFNFTISPSKRNIWMMIFLFSNISILFTILTFFKIIKIKLFYKKKTILFATFYFHHQFFKYLWFLCRRANIPYGFFYQLTQSFYLERARDLNPRPSRWQRDALPLSYARLLYPRPSISFLGLSSLNLNKMSLSVYSNIYYTY